MCVPSLPQNKCLTLNALRLHYLDPGFKVFLLILHDTSYNNTIDYYLFSIHFDVHVISLLKMKSGNSNIDLINHIENNISLSPQKNKTVVEECYISVGQLKLV